MSWRDSLRHAFAVDAPGPAEPTPEQEVPVDWICRQVHRRGLTTPGLIGLEMSRPLNAISSATLQILQPSIGLILPPDLGRHVRNLSEFLEHRGAFDHIAERLEQLRAEEAAQRAAADSPTPPEPDADP